MIAINSLIDKKIDEIINLKRMSNSRGYKDIDEYNTNWALITNIIISWYTIKYPKDIVRMKDYNNQSFVKRLSEFDIEKVEQLSKYMTYSELMNRIPKELHYLIECWYRDEEGQIKDNISGNIYKKNTNMKSEIPFNIYNKDGYVEESYFIKHLLLPKKYLSIDYLEAIINKNTYDITEMSNIVNMHKIDSKLRQLNLELIALKLLKSDEDILTGYIRARAFIIDFNNGLKDLLINKDILPSLEYLDLNNYTDLINNMLKTENKDNIDEFGLTFKTIQFLKDKNINNVEQLYNKSTQSLIYGDGIINFKIPKRDVEILDNMIELANIKYGNHMKEILKIANESPVKTKKKSIFNRKNKQK